MTGVVYFIGEQSADAVKIGYTGNSRRRYDGLQTAMAKPLVIFAEVPGTQSDERAFHDQFKRLRIRGEWFRRAGPLAEFLDEHEPRPLAALCDAPKDCPEEVALDPKPADPLEAALWRVRAYALLRPARMKGWAAKAGVPYTTARALLTCRKSPRFDTVAALHKALPDSFKPTAEQEATR